MSASRSDPPADTPLAQISAAIRAKRERTGTLDVGTALDALEADLLKDIEDFDLEAAARRLAEEERQGRRHAARDTELAFPDIVADGVAARPAAAGANAPAQAPGAPTAAPGAAGSASLLEQLRRASEVRQQENEQQRRITSVLEAGIDRALRQVFSFLHELCQQLNVLQPPVPRNYPVAGYQELQGLAWQRGFVDYRSRPESAGQCLESVNFNYRLVGSQPVVLERDGSVAETFRQMLFDLNLAVRVEEFRNERRHLERARFIVAPEVKVNVHWTADWSRGQLLVEARNLERLGSTRYLLPADAINDALLDEFGRLVLGQTHQFPRMLSR
jgi:hypothetical protein